MPRRPAYSIFPRSQYHQFAVNYCVRASAGEDDITYVTLARPWYLYYMVTHYMLRTHYGKWIFSGKNTRFVTALGVIKSLEQVE